MFGKQANAMMLAKSFGGKIAITSANQEEEVHGQSHGNYKEVSYDNKNHKTDFDGDGELEMIIAGGIQGGSSMQVDYVSFLSIYSCCYDLSEISSQIYYNMPMIFVASGNIEGLRKYYERYGICCLVDIGFNEVHETDKLGNGDRRAKKTNWNKSTVLMIAAMVGDIDIIKFIIEMLTANDKSDLYHYPGGLLKYVLNQASENNEMRLRRSSSNCHMVKGNTALMIAAHYGHLRAVQVLVDAGADINATCFQLNTALILAAGGNHIDVVKLLIEKDEAMRADGLSDAKDASDKHHMAPRLKSSPAPGVPSKQKKSQVPGSLVKECAEYLITQTNTQGKTVMHVAVENGAVDVVEYLLDEKIEYLELGAKTSTNPVMNVLTYACKGTLDHDTILERLLEAKIPDIVVDDKVGDTTPLCFASKTGSIRAIENLLKHHADINMPNYEGYTPIMRAAEAGNIEAARLLIRKGAAKWKARDGNVKENAMMMALMNAHIELATECFMSDVDDDRAPVTMLDADWSDVLSLDNFDRLMPRLLRRNVMESLAKHAADNNFHFSLFMHMFQVYCMDSTKSLETFLKFGITCFFEHLRSRTLRDGMTDVDIVHKLVQVSCLFLTAKSNHPLMRGAIQEYYDNLDEMIANCLNTARMGIEKNINDALCYVSMARCTQVFANELVQHAYAFSKGPIALSVESNSTSLFCSGEISIFLDNLMWNFLRKPKFDELESFLSESADLVRGEKKSTTEMVMYGQGYDCIKFLHGIAKNFLETAFENDIKKGLYPTKGLVLLHSEHLYVRYCPGLMLLLEGLSKLVCLALTIWQTSTFADKNNQFYSDEATKVKIGPPNGVDYTLLVMILSLVLYEWGELCGHTTSIRPTASGVMNYFTDLWDQIDVVSYILLIGWMIFRFDYTNSDPYGLISHGFLSTSTISMSIAILRYLTIQESFGKLTIMMFKMIQDLYSFAIVFFVVLLGFSVALKSMLQDALFDGDPDPYFQSWRGTWVTMFSAALGNYDMVI